MPVLYTLLWASSGSQHSLSGGFAFSVPYYGEAVKSLTCSVKIRACAAFFLSLFETDGATEIFRGLGTLDDSRLFF